MTGASFLSAVGATKIAQPKSHIFAWLVCGSTSMFEGLISRWMIPSVDKWWSPVKIPRSMFRRSILTTWPERISCRKLFPKDSIAMKSRPRGTLQDPSSLTMCADLEGSPPIEKDFDEARRRIRSSLGSPTKVSRSQISLTAMIERETPQPHDAGASSQYICHTLPNVPFPSMRSTVKHSLGVDCAPWSAIHLLA